MDHNTLYAHMLRDITFIHLIFKEKSITEDTIQTVKTRVSELMDMTLTQTFKHFPHLLKELAANKIYQLDKAWQSIESVEDFLDLKQELENETSYLLKKIQENKSLLNAA